jgi:hypothetical protein
VGQFGKRPLDGVRQLDRVHVVLRVARKRLTGVERHFLQGASSIFPPITVHCNIARRLVQVGPWLLYLRRIGFEHPHEGIVGQVLGLLAIAQATGPGADQLFVMLEKAGSAGQLGDHRGALWGRDVNSNGYY